MFQRQVPQIGKVVKRRRLDRLEERIFLQYQNGDVLSGKRKISVGTKKKYIVAGVPPARLSPRGLVALAPFRSSAMLDT